MYNSSKYQVWRQFVFTRDGFTCRLCGKKGGELNAHHIKKKSKYRTLIYNQDNGITLCKKCHDAITRNEEIFERLFSLINKQKLTLEYIYSFFNLLCVKYPRIVKKLKEIDKWTKIPKTMIGYIYEKPRRIRTISDTKKSV